MQINFFKFIFFFYLFRIPSSGMDNVQQIKIGIVGDVGVGKTALVNRFINDEFSMEYEPTREFYYKEKELLFSEAKVKIKILDTGGDKFHPMPMSQLRKVDGVIIVFSVVDFESFTNIQNWIDEVNHYTKHSIAKIIIGNKIDLSNERVTDCIRGKEVANGNKYQYFETSAQDTSNVETAFMELINQLSKVPLESKIL